MKSVNRKNWENTADASSSAVPFAAESVRNLKIRIGRRGAFERNSITTKLTASAAETARAPTVIESLQPCWVARVIA